MASNRIEIPCDMNQGFNFRKDVMTQIGMINTLKIGDVDLTADITLKDPENNQTDKKVVGVLNYIGWSAAATDQVSLAVQVSESAKNKLDGLTKKNMSNVEVVLDFDCYTYDPSEKKYFKHFHSNDIDLKGLIFGEGDDLAIRIHLDQNQMVQAPRNYTLELGIKPQPTAQELHYASSVTDKLVLQWGITEA
ncbi:MAG: hypothetical protein VX589_09715 [Myxococcota bacterium]|nr:hypothetical protein [Myxococcota bacterium]